MSAIFANFPHPSKKLTNRKTDHSPVVPGEYENSQRTLKKNENMGWEHLLTTVFIFSIPGKWALNLTNLVFPLIRGFPPMNEMKTIFSI